MSQLRLGVCLESLGLPLRQGLQAIERLGVTGVQVNAVGDLAPRTLSQTGRRDVRHLLRPHNLELTALGCPLRHGLDVAEGQEARITHIQGVLRLSSDLGPRIVLIQAGPIPDDPNSPRDREEGGRFRAQGRPADICMSAASPPLTAAAAAAEPPSVHAPEKGQGTTYTIDKRVGYRKEDKP